MTKKYEKLFHTLCGEKVELRKTKPAHIYPENPILTAQEVNKSWDNSGYHALNIFNSGAFRANNKYSILFSSITTEGIAVIGFAQSTTGVATNTWEINPGPLLQPADRNDIFSDNVDIDKQINLENGGIHTPRITNFKNEYAIVYDAYNKDTEKNTVCLASTIDFKKIVRLGSVSDTDIIDLAIIPKKINNKYVAFKRKYINKGQSGIISLELCFTEDWRLNKWETFKELYIYESLNYPKNYSGSSIVETQNGWILIFTVVEQNSTVLKAAYYDLQNPHDIKLSQTNVLCPEVSVGYIGKKDYQEKLTISSNGAVSNDEGRIFIFYSENETVLNSAVTHEDMIINLCFEK